MNSEVSGGPGEGCGAFRPAPLRALAQPVTGGVKTPVMPTRAMLQRLLASGMKVAIPAFFILSVWWITPLALERLVVTLSFGALMWTRTPATALPFFVTWIVSFVFRPTNSCLGV